MRDGKIGTPAYLWHAMKPTIRHQFAAPFVFLALVGCDSSNRQADSTIGTGLWSRDDGTSVLEFVPCCRLPITPGVAITIRKDLNDTHKLDVNSANLRMEMTYEPGSQPVEASFSDNNVKSKGDCTKAVSGLSKATRAKQRFNFFPDGTQGLVAVNGQRVVTFNIDCSAGGCMDAAKMIEGIEIPTRSEGRWSRGCAGFAD